MTIGAGHSGSRSKTRGSIRWAAVVSVPSISSASGGTIAALGEQPGKRLCRRFCQRGRTQLYHNRWCSIGCRMKKLINDSEAVVDEMLDGMVAAYPEQLRRLDDTEVMVRADAPVSGKVGIVSGGGSGHEPTHAGYLGAGMLDGAAAGEVFTSPTADQLEELVAAADSGEGVLMVIKNYEGDVMNFETAGEMVEMEGTDVAQVVVDDDVAVEDSLYTSGRRGVCGTILVHKAAGAKAAEGADLEEVQRVGQKVIDNVGTMGMALTSCVTPEKGEATFDLPEDEIELGIGIHGEPGVERTDVMSADEITAELTENVLDDLK